MYHQIKGGSDKNKWIEIEEDFIDCSRTSKKTTEENYVTEDDDTSDATQKRLTILLTRVSVSLFTPPLESRVTTMI